MNIISGLFQGLVDSCRFDLVYPRLKKYDKIRECLGKSLVLNILIICQQYIIITRVLDLPNFISIIYFAILCSVSLVLNNMWRDRIAKSILERNKVKSTKGVAELQKKNMGTVEKIYLMVYDNISMIYVYIFNVILLNLVYYILILTSDRLRVPANIFYTCATAIVYSAYFLEYKMKAKANATIRGRLMLMEYKWPYFLGYSLLIAVLGNYLSLIIFWGLSEFVFTILLIISFYTRPMEANTYVPIFSVQRRWVPPLADRTMKLLLKKSSE